MVVLTVNLRFPAGTPFWKLEVDTEEVYPEPPTVIVSDVKGLLEDPTVTSSMRNIVSPSEATYNINCPPACVNT